MALAKTVDKWKTKQWFDVYPPRGIASEIIGSIPANDEKAVLGSELTEEEREFYNQNLSVIAEYYDSNAAYWASKQPL